MKNLTSCCSMVIWVWTRAWNVHCYGIYYDQVVEVWESSLPALTRVCSSCLYSFHGSFWWLYSGYINTRPLVCIYLNDKHAHWYSSLRFKAQMKCPTILKVVALPNFEHFWSHYQVGYFLRITLSFATSHVVPNLLIIKLWHCPLGAINLKNVFCERKMKVLSFV